jgi:hypothetical protein
MIEEFQLITIDDEVL